MELLDMFVSYSNAVDNLPLETEQEEEQERHTTNDSSSDEDEPNEVRKHGRGMSKGAGMSGGSFLDDLGNNTARIFSLGFAGNGMSGGMEIDLPYSSSRGYHRYGFGMSGGNFDGLAIISHMQRMLRDIQTITPVPNHVLQRLFNITVNWEQGNISREELLDFYRGFNRMYRSFFPAIGGSLSDLPSIEPQRRIFPSPKLDIRDTLKPLRF
jgi:hypothetical protein